MSFSDRLLKQPADGPKDEILVVHEKDSDLELRIRRLGGVADALHRRSSEVQSMVHGPSGHGAPIFRYLRLQAAGLVPFIVPEVKVESASDASEG